MHKKKYDAILKIYTTISCKEAKCKNNGIYGINCYHQKNTEQYYKKLNIPYIEVKEDGTKI